MTIYDFSSGVLTVIGYTILVYRIIHDLQSTRTRKIQIERLCTKWLIFTIFLKLEDYLLVIFDIIPFGKFLLLMLKLFLFLPQNSISHSIYKRIHKVLERFRLQEYHSHSAIALSFICRITVALLLKLSAKIAAYIDLEHIEQIERHILEIIKVLEYKKTAINMRHQAPASDVNKELNASQFNNSIVQDYQITRRKKNDRTNIGQQMNRILLEENNGQEQRIKLKAQVMKIKPNKSTKTKAKYAQVELQYICKTSQLNLITHRSIQTFILKEIRWITKNMMNIEVVFQDGGSKIIRIKDMTDVVKWVEPVCVNLQRLQESQNT